MKFSPTKPQALIREHLHANHCAALFVGCGMGKTAATLSFLTDLFADAATDGVLVVAPVRVVNLTWPAEIRKWEDFRPLRFASLRTPEGWEALERAAADVYLINYEILPQLRDRYLKGRRKIAFDTVVFDELTRAKNHKSKRINSVRPYFERHCPRRIGLTGTPTPNGLLDLFAQVRLLDGGERLGKSYTLYRSTYFYPVDYHERNWQPKEDARERIYRRLDGFALSLKSSDWLNIPDMEVEDVSVPLAKEAVKPYRELVAELITELRGVEIVSPNAAVLSNKLLQITSGAVYAEDGKSWQLVHNEKMKVLLSTLKGLRGLPAIVLCQFRHEQERMRKAIANAEFFEDAKTAAAQEKLVERWNAGKVPVLVAHPASLGHGLNMQGTAAAVVWFSLPWSPELYDQAIRRVARMGQEHVTKCLRLITRDTVEEAVAEALRRKDGEQAALLDALKTFLRI